MESPPVAGRAGRFFWAVTSRPKTVLLACLLALLACAAALPRLTRDTTTESFMPDDHPAVVYREHVREIFGLTDPIVVAVVRDGPEGVFNPESLALIDWLTLRLAEVPYIDPDRVTSIANANNIVGTEDGLVVEAFYDGAPTSQAGADAVRRSVMDFDLYVGNLVAEDGTAALILGELLDEDRAELVYDRVRALVAEAPRSDEQLYIAGEGAVIAALGSSINRDSRRLIPIGAAVIALVVFLAYRTLRGGLLPLLVVAGAVVAAMGTMSALGVPIYVVTNILPVVLISIGVADGIHILGQYYEEWALRPDAPQRELVVRAMVEMWQPVVSTSLTDVAGFLSIAIASFVPPMRALGVFASIGVLAAMLLSLFAIPALLTLLRARPSAAFAPRGAGDGPLPDRLGRAMTALGRGVVRRPRAVLGAAAAVLLVLVIGALRLEANESRIDNFRPEEAIFRADRAINGRISGTNFIDVVIEAREAGGLLVPVNLRRIEALQRFLERQPHVKRTVSIVDYLKQMNRALHEGRPEAYRLPDDEALVAQYFLLYSGSGDPTDFEEEIDTDYQLANVRVVMNSGLWSNERPVVEATERYLATEFNTPELEGTLSGRVNIHYHWFREVLRGHFRSTSTALIVVWLTSALVFRSLAAGTLAVLPVSTAVLLSYAVMGYTGIWLGGSTSMCAPIAIGLGVDFALHTIARLIGVLRGGSAGLDDAFSKLFASTGRALLFSSAALVLGFSVLTLSDMAPVSRMGLLIVICALASFATSLTVLPALVLVLRPRFLAGSPGARP